MWSVLLFVLLTSSVSSGQRTSRQGQGWDIRLAVPGEPGNDYPTLGGIPKTSFSCSGKAPGYYADVETNCQAFRVCTSGSTFGFQSFLCPNGTLFNQAVFVCDWWMNVNCENSQQYINANNMKFGNLKMGSQFMNDIKKMLTHPMRNPYDKTAMKSNYIVMQEYRAPSGQLFPSANLVGPQQVPESLYLPSAKLVQQNFFNGNSLNDNAISASTVSPLYSVPANNIQTPLRDPDAFQRQRQNSQLQSGQYIPPTGVQSGKYIQATGIESGKYVHQSGQSQNGQYNHQTHGQNGQYQLNHHSQSGNIINQGQASKLTQSQHNNHNAQTQQFIRHNQNQNYNHGNVQHNHQQVNKAQKQVAHQQGTTKQHSNSQSHAGKQAEFGISYSKQQYNANQGGQTYKTTLPQFSPEINGKVGNEVKQNLVSNGYGPATVIAKTLTFNRIIQEPKNGSPKSRITFKTWLVKPSKAARLTAEPTPYTYNRPTNTPPAEKLIVEPTAYYYDKPTTRAQKIVSTPEPYYYNPPKITTQAAKIVSESGYVYNKPTVAAKLVTEPTGYVYNRPTVAAKLVTRPTAPPTLPSRQYLTPASSPKPTMASRLYLAPTTFKPLARLYLPASIQPELSRQYLSPNAAPPSEFQSAKLQASPSTPTPVVIHPDNDKSLFSLIKHSRINTNHNNLTFTDILTKEKLDVTVNDIVKDTRNILGTAQPQQFGQLQEETSEDYESENYITSADGFTESGENLSPATPTEEINKSSRLVQPPASDLEPPVESHEEISNQNTNRIANLPFFKEPPVPTNTIERTVSLKISIPEKTAAYLFNASNDSDYDKLEILNTGSSNYLVLTNKFPQSTAPSFIPIGKLIVDKDSNFSNSQALVFSFLADSINQAKEYNSIAHQNIAQTQYQNNNNEDLAQITNKVAQLTSAQYNTNKYNNQNQGKHSSSAQNINSNKQLGTSAKYTNNNSQNEAHHLNANAQPQEQQNFQTGEFYSSQFQGGANSLNANLEIKNGQNQIYSGQLYQVPVPDVSSIYNGQSSANEVAQNNVRQQNSESADLHQNSENNHNSAKQSSAEVEIVQSQSLPVPAPAKLQAAPTHHSQPQSLTSQEDQSFGNFVNNGDGISAQLSDKIVGTIAHPSEENKLVTYKKDQSYYVYTKLDNFNNNGLVQSGQSGGITQNNGKSAKLRQGGGDNVVTFQFIPSVSYQLENEKDQQRLLNAFQIDEFGSPKENNNYNQNGNSILTSNVEYSVQHPVSGQRSGQYNSPHTLYSGPSSYSAPQSSVGRLEQQRVVPQSSKTNAAKLEQFDDRSNNGYSKVNPPSTSFTF